MYYIMNLTYTLNLLYYIVYTYVYIYWIYCIRYTHRLHIYRYLCKCIIHVSNIIYMHIYIYVYISTYIYIYIYMYNIQRVQNSMWPGVHLDCACGFSCGNLAGFLRNPSKIATPQICHTMLDYVHNKLNNLGQGLEHVHTYMHTYIHTCIHT